MDNAELTVLELCLLCDDVTTAVKFGVKEDWFTTDKNKKLWHGLVRQKEEGKDLDLIWAHDYMNDETYSEKLSRICVPMKNPQSELRSAIEILKKHYLIRKTKDILLGYLIDNIKTDDPLVVIDHAVHQLVSLMSENQPLKVIDVKEEIKQRITTGIKIKTGFRNLDAMTKGIEPALWLIAGFPQVGKTTFVTNLTLNVARQHFSVVIFSGETSKVMMSEKIATMLSGINPYYGLTEEQEVEFMDYVEQVEQLPIKMHETLSLTDIIMEIQKKESPLYIIDYLQLIKINKRFESREREVNYIIQELARLKQECQVCIIAISSLNRRNWDEIPTLANLKDSGSLEYASDYVLLLDKPIRRVKYEDLKQAKKEGKDRVIKGYFAKNRLYGIEDELCLDFDKQSLRITETVKRQ